MQRRSLFTDSFSSPETDEELQELIGNHPSYDSYYVASGAIEDRREHFDKLYSKYHPHTDRNFLSAVKHDFHGRTWEMYLSVVLLNNGIEIESSDVGPDILVKHEGKKIWIECVACQRGDKADSVPPMEWNKIGTIPEEKMRIRIASSLADKKKVYDKYIEKEIIDKDDIFIIAVNGGMFGYPEYAYPRILQTLFAIGYPTLSFPVGGGEPVSGVSRISQIKKEGGGDAPMDFFLNEDNKGISAVIYSNNTVLNHPGTSGQGVLLVHNPKAKNPLSDVVLDFLKTYKVDERGGIQL